MSKLDLVSRVPEKYEKAVFADIIRAICGQVNPLSETRLAARYNAQASVPTGTAISYAVGDFVPDNNCTVGASVAAGTALSYLRLGWVCRVAGTPGTFEEVRILTGSGGLSIPAVVSASPITNSLSSDVTLNNTANYFDGPSIAQGTVGTWFVSGAVTVYDSAASATFKAKLWDGTTVIASADQTSGGATVMSISLSGYLATPAGNLRISVKDASSTNGKILFNDSGTSKDSTISAFRIA